jgi:rhamnose utilization protein RhaD (predicted bifunctional aldolase and dehydrogenase)
MDETLLMEYNLIFATFRCIRVWQDSVLFGSFLKILQQFFEWTLCTKKCNLILNNAIDRGGQMDYFYNDMGNIQQLIEVSRHYGSDPAYVIAGGGNTSFKDKDRIWIKASGIPLAGIGESGFVCLSREKLGKIERNAYSTDPVLREEQVKKDMQGAIISPEHLRPSVETSLHNLIDYAYVVHTHPTLVNGLMCSMHVEKEVAYRFGTDALYVEYTDPGYILFKKLQEYIGVYREQHGKAPAIIFLQNHGVFVGADGVEKIHSLYESINRRIGTGINSSVPASEMELYESKTTQTIDAYFRSKGLNTKAFRCELFDHFSESREQYQKIARPFSPDIIVYCKSNYLFIEKKMEAEKVRIACKQFEEAHGYSPRVIIEEGGGLIAIEEDERSLQTVLEVFTDQMLISYLSENFGGPHFMSPGQIQFIDNWEVENYRRKVAKG